MMKAKSSNHSDIFFFILFTTPQWYYYKHVSTIGEARVPEQNLNDPAIAQISVLLLFVVPAPLILIVMHDTWVHGQ